MLKTSLKLLEESENGKSALIDVVDGLYRRINKRDQHLQELKQQYDDEDMRECTFKPHIRPTPQPRSVKKDQVMASVQQRESFTKVDVSAEELLQ